MTSVLKPGLLVSLKTSVRGGVTYERNDLEKEKLTDDGKRVAKWETTRRVENPDEYEAAQKTRSSAGSLIRRACGPTAFGLICSQENEEKLDEAIREARKLCDAFNDSAQSCKIGVWVLKGRIAATDDEAVRAVASEIQTLLDNMKTGIETLDAEAIRKAATDAKKLEQVLNEDEAARVTAAVEAARRAAREITKRVEKGSEDAVKVLKDLKPDLSVVEGARFAFLDMQDAPEETGEKLPVAELKRFAGLEHNKEDEVA